MELKFEAVFEGRLYVRAALTSVSLLFLRVILAIRKMQKEVI